MTNILKLYRAVLNPQIRTLSYTPNCPIYLEMIISQCVQWVTSSVKLPQEKLITDYPLTCNKFHSPSSSTQFFLLWKNIHDIKFTILAISKYTVQWLLYIFIMCYHHGHPFPELLSVF